MSKTTYTGFTRLIGLVAADVHEMHTLVEHIDSLADRCRSQVLAEVLDCFGFSGSGYIDPAAYLNALHWYYGQCHLDIVRDLQRWASPRDPALDDEGSDLYQHGALYARHRALDGPTLKRKESVYA